MGIGYESVSDITDCTYAVTHDGILSYINDEQGESMDIEHSYISDIAGRTYAVTNDGVLQHLLNPCEEFAPKQVDVKDVIFNPPATIVLWSDGTKTVSKCSEDDSYEERLGFLICVAKKYFGSTTRYMKVMEKFNVPDYGLVDIIKRQLDPDMHTTFIEEE